jgi:hypothetical protein
MAGGRVMARFSRDDLEHLKRFFTNPRAISMREFMSWYVGWLLRCYVAGVMLGFYFVLFLILALIRYLGHVVVFRAAGVEVL